MYDRDLWHEQKVIAATRPLSTGCSSPLSGNTRPLSRGFQPSQSAVRREIAPLLERCEEDEVAESLAIREGRSRCRRGRDSTRRQRPREREILRTTLATGAVGASTIDSVAEFSGADGTAERGRGNKDQGVACCRFCQQEEQCWWYGRQPPGDEEETLLSIAGVEEESEAMGNGSAACCGCRASAE
ncbi:hypothetical protein BHE74_00044012 [Ensete ventricosum]|nr:hypothetical protein BHE74_00044012 [Ensete ventricosum]